MSKRIFTEDLFPSKDKEDIVELAYEKRKKIYLNIGLITIYVLLLVVSLFVI